jgi:hypothetical protein
MKMRQWLVVVFGCLALAGAPLMGCGEDSDPSDSNNSSANNNNNNNNNQPDSGQPDSGPEPDADDEEDGGTEPDTGPDLDPSDCDPNLNFTGQVYDQGDEHSGGQPTAAADVTLADANLQEVWDAIPGEDDDPATVDIDVTEALVIATVDGHGRLYVQDANAVLLLWYPWADGESPTDPVKVGDTVSFKVTEVQNFGGTPQVSAITNFSVEDSDAQVPYHALSGEDLPTDSWGELVQVGGFVMSIERQDCGGDSVCYELVHGDNFDKSTTLRSASSFLEVGNCVTYFGPLSSFPGPKNDDGQTPDPQLDQINFDWLFSLQ